MSKILQVTLQSFRLNLQVGYKNFVYKDENLSFS